MRKVEVRGVWWIDFGPGVVTVDLNRLEQSAESEFYAQELEMRVFVCLFVCLFVVFFLRVSNKEWRIFIENRWNGWSDLVLIK